MGPPFPYQILIKSNQLAGEGSVNMPEKTTAGVNPHSNKVLVFWNMKLISINLNTAVGDFTRLLIPLDFRRLGTGILFMIL